MHTDKTYEGDAEFLALLMRSLPDDERIQTIKQLTDHLRREKKLEARFKRTRGE